jgi:predicted membrane chloride channel (bestrophin family)
MDADDRQREKHMTRQLAESLGVMYREMRRAGLSRLLSSAITLQHYRTLTAPDNPMDEVAGAMLEMIESQRKEEDDY